MELGNNGALAATEINDSFRHNLLIVHQPHHCDAIFNLLPGYYDSRRRCVSVLRSVWKAHTVSDIKSAR